MILFVVIFFLRTYLITNRIMIIIEIVSSCEKWEKNLLILEQCDGISSHNEIFKWLHTWLVEVNWCRFSSKFIRAQNFNANQMLFYCYYYCDYANAACYLMCLHTTLKRNSFEAILFKMCAQTALVIFKWILKKIQEKMIELNFHFHLKGKNTCRRTDTHWHTGTVHWMQ